MLYRSYIFFLLIALHGNSQVKLQGSVKDSKTKENIPYCAVGIKNTATGCLANDEGLFQISGRIQTDTLLVHYIGYEEKQVPLAEFAKNPVIYIDRKETTLNEVVIYSNDDYLYDIFDNCRKSLFLSKQAQSKVYYVLETEIGGQPVELLECYYNGRFNNSSVKELNFKNGRVGIAPYNNRYFINLNISKAFTFIDIANANDQFPAIPFQLDKKKLKKQFRLVLKNSYNDVNPVYHIAFTPVKDNGDYFSGDAWIEKNSGRLKKISFFISKTRHHPFLPMFKAESEIKNVSMQITKTYVPVNGENLLSHIDFSYQLDYHHIHQTSLLNPNADTSFEVKSKGLMQFYDHGKLFIPPYFNYDADLSDYRKISALTHNEAFWASNAGLVYSEKMKKGIAYFKKNGQLINYKNTRSVNQNNALRGLWGMETNYLVWSDKTRISLKKDGIKNDTVAGSSTYSQFLADKYKLKAQLFLDLNPMEDSVQHYSATVFDVYETFYNIPQESFTNCFLNIYFDLFEIERRKMEKVISENKFTANQFDSLYKLTCKNLDLQTMDYLREVERGKNYRALEKWNLYVKQNVGIDNLEVFGLRNAAK
jgi:hypothetical protein